MAGSIRRGLVAFGDPRLLARVLTAIIEALSSHQRAWRALGVGENTLRRLLGKEQREDRKTSPTFRRTTIDTLRTHITRLAEKHEHPEWIDDFDKALLPPAAWIVSARHRRVLRERLKTMLDFRPPRPPTNTIQAPEPEEPWNKPDVPWNMLYVEQAMKFLDANERTLGIVDRWSASVKQTTGREWPDLTLQFAFFDAIFPLAISIATHGVERGPKELHASPRTKRERRKRDAPMTDLEAWLISRLDAAALWLQRPDDLARYNTVAAATNVTFTISRRCPACGAPYTEDRDVKELDEPPDEPLAPPSPCPRCGHSPSH